MNEPYVQEAEAAVEVLRSGGTLLYPTDTVWGLGCDATNHAAVEKIYQAKQRPDGKALVVLVAEERDVLQYVAALDLAVFDFIQAQSKPTTVVFDGAVGLADNLIAADGSVAIRVVQDPFCRYLIKRLRKPIVSTSANVSGEPAPRFFREVSKEITDAVDCVVRWRQHDETPATPSQIVRWKGNGSFEVIRP